MTRAHVPAQLSVAQSHQCPRYGSTSSSHNDRSAGRRILIVEDQRLIAADLENALKEMGYAVVATISSGEEAAAAAKASCPELVLIDTAHGSTFAVQFRFLPSSTCRRSCRPSIRLDRVRVLLVDDQTDAREAVGAILLMFGAEVAAAASVPEALESAKAFKPNVLLAHIAMPGQNGYDLSQQMRAAEEPELRGWLRSR
jgi:PleD family two-component response regulator